MCLKIVSRPLKSEFCPCSSGEEGRYSTEMVILGWKKVKLKKTKLLVAFQDPTNDSSRDLEVEK